MYGEREGFRGRTVVRGSLFVVRYADARQGTPLLTKAAILPLQPGQPAAVLKLQPMSYRVVAFTMAQVRQGALQFQRDLSAALREYPGIKVYSASPFDLDERRRIKDRFGGDVVYFLNDEACRQCEQAGLDLHYLAEVSDEELPRRRTLVVGRGGSSGDRRVG